MKVILLQSVQNVGQKGDIKDVKPGFAQNKLIPQKLAAPISDSQAQLAIASKKSRKKTTDKDIDAIRAALKQLQFIVQRDCNEQGTLYSAVDIQDVQNVINQAHIAISVASMKPKHIKTIGEHTVEFILGHNIRLTVPVVVKQKK